jgi:hypothetical protein
MPLIAGWRAWASEQGWVPFSRALPEVRHVDPTVCGLASVNCLEMKSEHARLSWSRDVKRLIALPCRKSVNPTVYALVKFCILLTLHVNKVELQARASELVYSRDVDGYLHGFIYHGGDIF